MKKKECPEELKHHLFECYEEGESVKALSIRFGPTPAIIYRWLDQIQKEQSQRTAQTLARLEAENLELRRQNAFLKKAAAWTSYVMSSPISPRSRFQSSSGHAALTASAGTLANKVLLRSMQQVTFSKRSPTQRRVAL